MTPEEDRERRNARFRERYATEPEFRQRVLDRGRGSVNKVKRTERARRWRAANPEKVRAQDVKNRAKNRTNPDYVEKARKRAREWYRTHPHRRLATTLSKYDLTPAEFAAMAEAQGGVCAICEQPEPTRSRLAVDHDHVTGSVRGLLCHFCNQGLGLLGDDPARVEAAAAYLRESRTVMGAPLTAPSVEVCGVKRGYTVTVTMTPRQAVDAAAALQYAAVGRESARLFSAAGRVTAGLFDAGWNLNNHGTEDEPIWVWEKEEAE